MHIETFLNAFKKNKRTLLKQIFLSVVLIAASIFVKVWIPAVGRDTPFLIFTTAIIASAWFGGLISAVLSTIMAAAVAQFFIVGPNGIFSSDYASSLQSGVFLCEGLLLSIVISRSKNAEEDVSVYSNLLSKLFSKLKDAAIVVLNEKGQVVHWSDSALKLTGFSTVQTMGKHVSFLYTHEGKKQGIIKREIKFAINKRELQEKNWILTKNGRRVYVQDETLPVIDKDGKTNLIIKILTMLPNQQVIQVGEKDKEQLTTPFIPTIMHA